jgi:hypothetical protein
MSTSLARIVSGAIFTILLAATHVRGDGKLFRPRSYKDSLEELSQEAILIFNHSEQEGGSFEDLIIKIHVKGNTDRFAWVIPFPNEPRAEKENGQLFEELHTYVQHRLEQQSWRNKYAKGEKKLTESKKVDDRSVEVLSRRIVGTYDVAVVRENVAGALEKWLETEGFQAPPADSEDVIGFYRKKGYVFACVKVKDASSSTDGTLDLHPLRFSFQTGGYDGIYFPMKMSGLQDQPFNVNLHIFYRAWLNDRLNRYGYVHRGFHLHFRDWDSSECEPNAGKSYSAPDGDPYLRDSSYLFPAVTRLFHKLHPGERYYLTNIQAYDLKPADVRQWSDDLWLFPYYSRRGMVPYDARPGGIASAAWPGETFQEEQEQSPSSERLTWIGGGLAAFAICCGVSAWLWRRKRTVVAMVGPRS